MFSYYSTSLGLPVNWKHDPSGVLPVIIGAFTKGERLNPEEFAHLKQYFFYYINAPCWKDSISIVPALRAKLLSARTQQDLNHWLNECNNQGIEPI